MMMKSEFVNRVLAHLPTTRINQYTFTSWSAGRPTNEGLGMLPVLKVDKKRLIDRIMDVDRYLGNIAHITECRKITRSTHNTSKSVHFYQRIKIPLIGTVHHELVMEHIGSHQGYDILAWRMLEAESAALSKEEGMRSQYNEGCWLISDDVVGYALNSAPLKSDLGFMKWKAMTKGADMAASKIMRENIEGMSRWAAREP